MAPQLSNLEILDRYEALGLDFLTWLVVESLRDTLEPPPSEPGLVVIAKGPLVLESPFGEATKVTLAGDEAANSPEFQTALLQGKRVVRCKLEFTAQDATWLFTLDARTFDLKSMKLPVPKVADLNEYVSLRVQASQHVAHVLSELFDAFLLLRSDAERWPDVLGEWSEWIRRTIPFS